MCVRTTQLKLVGELTVEQHNILVTRLEFQRPLDKPLDKPFEITPNQLKEHPQDLCEKCQSLGHYCQNEF